MDTKFQSEANTMPKKAPAGRLESRDEAFVVEGRVIRPDLVTPISNAGGGFLLVLASLCGLALMGNAPLHILRGRLYGFLLLGLLLLVGGVFVFLGLALRNRRLIIGEDRLQLIGALGDVLGQLPYDNIVESRMGREGGVEIVLDTFRRRDTWWPKWSDHDDCAIFVKPTLESDATALRMYLRNALREYRHRYGGRVWQHD